MAACRSLLAAVLLCGTVLLATAAPQQRLLVLLDDPALQQTHSRFLADLGARGYAVEVKPITDSSLQLKSWDTWLYDKLVILGSGKGERSMQWVLAAVGRAAGRQ